MFFLARKNLFQEKTRLLISVGGVAFSVLLIMVLQGLYRAWSYRMGEYIRTVPADLWVEQEGGKDMFHSISILPASAQAQIENVAGVTSAKPFIGRRISFDVKGKEVIIFLVGYDTNTGAGPVRIVSGKSQVSGHEIILDRKVADDSGLKLGDKVNIGDEEFEVAGIAEGGDVVTLSYAFINAQESVKLAKLPGVVNYFIVKTDPSADNNAVIRNIESAVPGSKAVTKQQFVDDNTELIRETFLPVILVLVLISIAVGIAIIGLTIFTSTIEKAREYGVLKAIGIRNSQLYKVVLEQSMIASIIGFAVGAFLAIGLSWILSSRVAEFVTLLKVSDGAWILGLTIIMASVATLLPSRRLAKIDPAEVFRS